MRILRSAVFWIVLINALIFGYQTMLPGQAQVLFIYRWGLSAAGLESGAVWQLVTHAFLHGNLWHILANMVTFWFAGRLVEQQIGSWTLLSVYLFSAMGGGILQMLLGPPGIELIGASGAVFGILLVFTTIYRDNEILLALFFVIPLRLRAKYLAYGLVGFSLLALLTQFEPWIGHAAHLGGAITGYLFARALGYGTATWPERIGARFFGK